MDPTQHQFGYYVSPSDAPTTTSALPEWEEPRPLCGNIVPSTLFAPEYGLSLPPIPPDLHFLPPELQQPTVSHGFPLVNRGAYLYSQEPVLDGADGCPTMAGLSAVDISTFDFSDLEIPDLYAPGSFLAPPPYPPLFPSWDSPRSGPLDPRPPGSPAPWEPSPNIAETYRDPPPSTLPHEPGEPESDASRDADENLSVRVWKYIDSRGGDGQFACLWECPKTGEICGRKSSLDLLKRHIWNVHFVSRPWNCEQCGHKFFRKSLLTQHLNVHTGEKPYPCNECDGWFASSSARSYHKKRSHP